MSAAEIVSIEQFDKRRSRIADAITYKIITSDLFRSRQESFAEYSAKMIRGMLEDKEITFVQEDGYQMLDTNEAMEHLMVAVYNLTPEHGVITSVREVVHGAVQNLHKRGVALLALYDNFFDDSVTLMSEDDSA